MKKQWILMIVVSIAVGFGAFAVARAINAPPRGYASPDPGFQKLHDYLALTPEQLKKIKDLDVKYSKTREELRKKIWDARDVFMKVVDSEAATRAQVSDAARKVGLALTDMQVNSAEYMYDMNRILTAKQRQQMRDVMGRGMCGVIPGGPMPPPMGEGMMHGPADGRGGPREGPDGGIAPFGGPDGNQVCPGRP